MGAVLGCCLGPSDKRCQVWGQCYLYKGTYHWAILNVSQQICRLRALQFKEVKAWPGVVRRVDSLPWLMSPRTMIQQVEH